ncbi:MAG: hypothetical protein UT61_C0025G0004 [Candidatus Woesebacteria bacterium GW2011_GWA1_39_8]|uniref:Late embryogenesis abundant protein LEA-2 subgroup domain-containing protein n=1 Tax=Candidatus Woesebacteria bacterium GW2011_GWA1_39_8 TaxID=1618552 RepID=A0A0G0SVR2_9BACT|nr:MAG: hypothetical protein UT61_C0025G0004 [Candidatus Woesebacteria bacterium GW2011_GWA1_39_8]
MKTALKILGIVTVFGFIGLGIYGVKIYRDIKNVCYELIKYELGGFNEKGNYVIKFWLKIKNISILKINITGYNIDIAINDTKVGNVKGNKEQKINPEAYSVLHIPLEIDVKRIFGLLTATEFAFKMSFDLSKIIISIRGKMAAQVYVYKYKILTVKTIPIEYSVTLQEITNSMNNPSQTKC